jgi:hypothetical protein
MELSGTGMFYLTWALQIILAVKFLSSAFIHAFRQNKPTLQYGIQKMGPRAKPILAVISALLALEAVMLVLPRALGWDAHGLCRCPRRAADVGIDIFSSEVSRSAEGVGI